MIPQDWRKYVITEKEKYKKLSHVECPAFGNEFIYFNYYGLNHIFYKSGILRSKKEIIDRCALLPYVPNILMNLRIIDGEEKRVKENSFAYFWTIKHQINPALRLRIIVRRLNNGTLHFFSVMRE